ncbi:MAG: Rpn family recombination-promoting nuclease/putative transposase [Clostridia bacterium]
MARWMRPCNDFVFKRIFGVEENSDLLLSFLNAVLRPQPGAELTEITLIDPHLIPDQVGDKASILDVKAITRSGERINIEVQLHNKYDMEKRALYYWAKMYEEQLGESSLYKHLRKTITINILDFQCLPTDAFHSIFRLQEESRGFLLTNDLEIHFLELSKLRGSDVNMNDPLVNWLLFVGAQDERTVDLLARNEPVIRKAKTVLEFLNQNDEARKLYEIRVKALRDEANMIEGAKEEGRAEGEAKGKAEIAKNMLVAGMSIEQISALTGLSPVEIKRLAKQ